METISQENCAILKIAHLISALDGDISEEERDLLLDTAKKVAKTTSEQNHYRPPVFTACYQIGVTKEKLLTVDDFMKEVEKSEGRLLESISRCKTQQQILTEFLAQAKPDYAHIRGSFVRIKKAFAIWIAMAMSDHKYNDIERLAIRKLQAMANASVKTKKITNDILERMERKLLVLSKMEEQKDACDAKRKEFLKESRQEVILSLHGVITEN